MEENVTIEEVILNVSKKIVNKRKTRILFFIISFIFFVIAFIFVPEFRAISNSNGPNSSIALMIMSGIVSTAGICLWATLLPIAFNFKPKPQESIAAIDKALAVYILEMRLTLYQCKNTLEALKEIPCKCERINERIAKTEENIVRLKEHLKIVDEKSEAIKMRTAQLALAG